MTDFITAGSLDVSGTFEFSLDDPDALAGLMNLAEPPRHDVRVGYPDGADRTCPACHEPATAVVVEAVSLMFTPGRRIAGSSERPFQLSDFDPAAYRAEPCGHRFGRDGKEIGRGQAATAAP